MTSAPTIISALRLARTPRIGPVTYTALINRFGSPQDALDALPELAARGGGKPPTPPPLEAVEAELAELEQHGCQLLVKGSADFPPLLTHLEDCPPVLTLRGDAALLQSPMVGMVGARNASTVGRKLASKLATDLGKAQIVIASGLARGIDTAAHQGALASGTVAVVAGGINRIYPRENEGLYWQMAERGAILSEMPWNAEPKAHLFPRRNRIVSGMSLGIIVVEAAQKSGSLITARLAGEQGRQVFAVPGNPLDPRAAGANHLIREGATLIRDADDVLDDILPTIKTASMPTSHFETVGPTTDDLTTDAQVRSRVLEALSTVPVQMDDLIRDTGMTADTVNAAALELELAGKLERHAGGRLARAV